MYGSTFGNEGFGQNWYDATFTTTDPAKQPAYFPPPTTVMAELRVSPDAQELHLMYMNNKYIGIQYVPIHLKYYDTKGRVVNTDFAETISAELLDSRGDEEGKRQFFRAVYSSKASASNRGMYTKTKPYAVNLAHISEIISDDEMEAEFGASSNDIARENSKV